MRDCAHCGAALGVTGLNPDQPKECPNCGKPLVQPPQIWETGLGIIKNYFFDVWQILTQPTLFFRRLPIRGGMIQPITFALITHWIGSSVGFLWHILIGGSLGHYIGSLVQSASDFDTIDNPGKRAQIAHVRDQILQWFFGAGSVIADPFFTLFSIVITSFIVFLGARILVSPGKDGHPEDISYESALRIICFGMAPAILATIPFLGGIISSLYVVGVTVIAAREVYRISTTRAALVALFPKLLFLGILCMGLFFVLFVVIKMFFSFF